MSFVMRSLALPAFMINLVLVAGCAATSEVGAAIARQAPADAQAVVAELAQQIPTAPPGEVVTAENDPNKLLGRPNGYTSKVQFTDTRIPPQPELEGGLARRRGVEAGGSVEWYPTEELAKARQAYIQAIAVRLPFRR